MDKDQCEILCGYLLTVNRMGYTQKNDVSVSRKYNLSTIIYTTVLIESPACGQNVCPLQKSDSVLIAWIHVKLSSRI